MISYCRIVSTAPERPVGNEASVAHNVTAKVDQFNGSYLSTVRDVETAMPVIPCTKTYRTMIYFDPGI